MRSRRRGRHHSFAARLARAALFYAAVLRGEPRPWACSRRRGHSTTPRDLGPQPAMLERGGGRGAGAAAEHSKRSKVRRVWARTRPVRLPSSVRAPYRRPWWRWPNIYLKPALSPMQGGDARGNVRYTAIGRISDRVLIATYHHYTTGAPASKVLHLVPPCRLHRASEPCAECG